MLLLEVLIALALISLCIIPLISPHVILFKVHKQFATTLELGHTVNQMYVEVLEKLHKNEISWNAIQDKQQISITNLLDSAQRKDAPFTGTYQFGEIIHKTNDKTGWSVYNLTVTFLISPRRGNDTSTPIKFQYSFPLLRHIPTDTSVKEDKTESKEKQESKEVDVHE